MSDDDAPGAPGLPGIDRYVEASRTGFERSLAAQRAAVDAWADAFDGRGGRTGEATPVRGAAWLFDVWTETLQNALVHLDDATSADGIDLDALQLVWLHAMDDALTDVGRSSEFAATMAGSVERTLTAKRWTDEVRRLLALEYRQKAVEDKLDAVLAAVEGAPDPTPAPPRGADAADAPGGEG